MSKTSCDPPCIVTDLILHELLELRCVLDVDGSIWIIQPAVVVDQLSVIHEPLEVVVLVHLEFVLHRTEICEDVRGMRRHDIR